MVKIKYIFVMIVCLFSLITATFATQEQIKIEMNEYVDQDVMYNPLKAGSGTWFDANENQSYMNITGYLTITNNNLNGKTMSDIYISFDYTTNVTLPVNVDGRVGTFISNVSSSNGLVIHIPELEAGENSTWIYSVNESNVRAPLNFTTSYSKSKLLAGDNITLFDVIENVFDNAPYQVDTCIYGINITQITVPVDFSGIPQDYYFLPITLGGSDSGNVTFAADNRTQYWDVFNADCLYKTNVTDINYIVSTPLNIPKTTHYDMINTTIRYNLNNTISHLRVVDITAISEASLSFEKKIMYPSHPTLYGSNVTWNVTGYFNTDTNITYNLTEVTMWVAKRTGISGDPNVIDNDTISNASLVTLVNPFVFVNNSQSWSSNSWLFNYSDIPSPIIWMDLNFTIVNDGTQLVNRSVTQNGRDIYIKELYLIIGYWLEINKNITALTNDSYNIKIDVHNKGNQVTPADTIVMIYDYVPNNFNVTSNLSDVAGGLYSSSPWYDTTHVNSSINGAEYNGTLHRWGLLPTNVLNTSFAPGPGFDVNTTWSVNYNVTGFGDYTLLDVFVTGLDPQRVDGAGSSSAVVVSEVIERISNTEGIFAAVASVLLLLGLLL